MKKTGEVWKVKKESITRRGKRSPNEMNIKHGRLKAYREGQLKDSWCVSL